MNHTTSNDPILQSYQLKHLHLKNRVFSACHEPNISEDGMPKERYRLYQEEKCKGGIGLAMFGGSACVSKDSEQAFGNLDLSTDEIIPYLQDLAKTTHQYDVPLMCQVTHMGRRNDGNIGNWLPVVSASCVREPAHRSFPKALEAHEIHRIVHDYAKAAKRCQLGDLDGIELEAYGHLMDAFWSPLTNFRDDEYGGSFENRMRFSLEVIDAIRQSVGDQFVVGIRMVFDELSEGGIEMSEGLKIAKCLEATGQIDFFNIIIGSIESDNSLTDVIPNMGTPVAPHIEKVKEIKSQLKTPILHSARINDVATARHCIRGEYMDLVGMTRSHFADPYIIKKIMEGEEDRIRPCVGASFCLDRIYKGGAAYCIHNAATMRESTMPHVITNNSNGEKKTIVIIGAGPAGLEAARVSAKRGHRVVVLEASESVGGQVRLAAKLARRSELIGIVDWLFNECQLAGVEFHYNVYADVDDVLNHSPDIVIDATGGIPNTEFVKGGDNADTTWDILSGNSVIKDGAIIYDNHGDHQALTCAEYMLNQGAKNLTIISPDRMLGQDLGGNNYPPYYKVFHQHSVEIILNTYVTDIVKKGTDYEITLYSEFSKQSSKLTCPQLIVEHGTLPMTELYDSLKPLSKNLGEVDIDELISVTNQTINKNNEGRFQLYRVGDAQSSRNIHAAIYDALRLCCTF